ncbi:MAG TPA: hypothetical protein VKS62_08740 [Methylomirabilota bacterium]|jgi:hypothetical protein|nr:hypothetical protein [Methylomirabilota bacterium]
MSTRRIAILVWALGLVAASTQSVAAHGLIGQRFFPATLAIDDPFVADELSLPTVLHIRNRGSDESPPTLQTDLSGELSKRLSPNLGLSLGGTYTFLDPIPGKSTSGFDNMEVSLKYVFWQNAEHETLLSAGASWEIGGTGSKKIGADSFDTVTPQFFFGKGFGDLPDAVDWLKPAALTGALGLAIPVRRLNKTFSLDDDGNVQTTHDLNPKTFNWGFSVQYNLQYLQSFVRDVGLPAPFNRMIPVVEFAMQTPIEGPHTGRTTGTINPGIIWFGRYMQLSVEAVIPANTMTGKNVGVLAQIHFYLDDIAPKIFTWTPFHGVLGPTQPQ